MAAEFMEPLRGLRYGGQVGEATVHVGRPRGFGTDAEMGITVIDHAVGQWPMTFFDVLR
jgi:hypothetical protein